MNSNNVQKNVVTLRTLFLRIVFSRPTENGASLKPSWDKTSTFIDVKFNDSIVVAINICNDLDSV